MWLHLQPSESQEENGSLSPQINIGDVLSYYLNLPVVSHGSGLSPGMQWVTGWLIDSCYLLYTWGLWLHDQGCIHLVFPPLWEKEIMGHAWPLTRTCGQTVPTFRVTWVLSPSWVLWAGKVQRSGQSTNLDHLWHISKISWKFKLLFPLALIWTKRLFPARVVNIMLWDSFSVRTMESTPVSTLTPSICGSTYPCWALGARATTKRWNNKAPCCYLDRMALD